MSALVLYALPPVAPGASRDVAEFDVSEAATAVAEALGVDAVAIRGDAEEALALLRSRRPSVVFNLVEAPQGRPDREAHWVALLEWMGIPFTGAGSETIALCRRKDRARAVLAAAGVPVPASGADAGFPCFVKPAGEDGSTGIFADSVCADAAARDRAVARLDALGLGPAHVEAYLPGRELLVALWTGAEGARHASVGEIRFAPGQRVVTYAAKWDPASPDWDGTPSHYPADVDDTLRDALLAAAWGAWEAVGAFGYLRVDFRLDAEGKPRVVDVNPNPDLAPDAGLARAVRAAGWTWAEFLRLQVALAEERT